MRQLPIVGRVYVLVVLGLAAVVLLHAEAAGLPPEPLVSLGVLFLACDALPAVLAMAGAQVTMSYAAVLAAVVLTGADGAAVVGACAVVTPRRPLTVVQRLFNGAQFALCGWAAGQVFAWIGPMGPSLEGLVVAFAAALVVFVALNMALTGGVLVASGQASASRVRRELRPLSGKCLGYGSLGLLIAGLWPAIGAAGTGLVLLPLLVAHWAFAQATAQRAAREATLAAFAQAVETKDLYTRGHSERVSRGSVMVAVELGLSPARVEAIRFTGMLHDVGKLGVPTKVLQKTERLTEEEFAAIQLHPAQGWEIVRKIGFLEEALGGILHHHEKLDGRGYPLGLAGDEIPEFARIIGVVDAFDAMTSTRSYRPARPVGEAVEELERCSGSEFDPVVVEAFLRALEREGWQPPDAPVRADLEG